MFKPNFNFHRITDITPDFLNNKGIKALILDVDNTLSTHHGMSLVEGLEDWLSLMKKEGIKLIILSNSKEKRVKPFAEKIGLDYISLGLKPLPFGYIKARKILSMKRKEVATVGDQIFTDVLGGNLYGIKTVMTDFILAETGPSFKFKRRIEKVLVKWMRLEKSK